MKRYPFSMAKHAHDIELAKNFYYSAERWDKVEEINGLLNRMMLNRSSYATTWLDGNDYAYAKRLTIWADSYRSEKIANNVSPNGVAIKMPV